MTKAIHCWLRLLAEIAGTVAQPPTGQSNLGFRPARTGSKLRLALLLALASTPLTTWAQACNTGQVSVALDYRTRTNENWANRATQPVPGPNSFTQVGTTYTSSDNNSTLQTGTLNNVSTLTWSANYSSSAANTSTVTYTFSRAVSNLAVQVQDIDAVFTAATYVPFTTIVLTPSSGFTDEVTFTGTNGLAPVATPTLTKSATANPFVTISNNVATGNTAAGDNTNAAATVTATFANPVTSVTIRYRNVTMATTLNSQSVGIDQLTWCRIQPTAAAVTTATVPSAATQVGIAGLNGTADGTPSYVVTGLPANGTLLYNSAGTTYSNVATGQVLTVAQAASLRYAPNAGFAGSSTTFTYQTRDDAGLTSAPATYTIPLQYVAPCTTSTTTLAFGSRTQGENWKTHAAEGVPAGSTATLISSGGYSNGAASTSTLQIGQANNNNTLLWNNQYSSVSTRTSQVTFTFSRAVSNFTVQVQDIDAGTGYVDQVVFQGANGSTPVTPVLTAVNPSAGITVISGNTAMGQNQAGTTNPADGTVTAYFASPITSLTLTYNNSSTSTTPGNQLIGIDQLTWCRALPTAVDVTSAALLSSVGPASISPLSSLADNVPVTYTLTSIPTAGTQGVLSYNSGGTTYTNITAAGQVLTAAQAASLRFAPVAGSSGNVTFTYKVTDSAGNLSANTATYTLPVVNSPCTTATATLNFGTSTPVPDDWKNHAPLAVPTGSTLTTLGSGNYQTPASATTSTLTVTGATATNNVNAVQTLAWFTDYANQADNTSSVTFTFSRPVSNYALRVQDIDKSEVAGNGGSAFIDQVTFAGANGATPVLPSLTAVGGANTVLITGNVATGTTNITNPTDGTVMAYFASPITSLTLTYRNTSTFAADPTNNAIGIDLLSFCRLAPVAANVTNPSRPSGQAQTAINNLSASADGTITSYTITALPDASQGTFFVNGVALTASTLTLTPAQAAQLSFAPAAGFSGNAGFSYYATDNANVVSNTATYVVPVTNSGAAGTPAACATPGKDGSPTLADNPDTYYPSTPAQALAVGAMAINVGTATIGGTTTTPTSIVKGDLLLVIQMQGADIDYSNTDGYGDGTAGGGASGNLNTNFTAGTYEYVVASNATAIAAATGGTITLASPLVNSYVNAAATTSAGPRRFQVIRVPQYGNLTLGGTLAATPWNGSTGGVIAFDVAGQTNFSNNTITAAGRGFRGGGGRTQSTTNYDSPDYVNLTAADLNAQKGEGTAGTPSFVNVPTTVNDASTNATVSGGTEVYPGSSTSRGAPGNAGGGGNDNLNNSGGGGGANGGFGGRGGDSFAGNKAIGGEPGASFAPASSSRLVLGGGGGAGTTNNSTGTPASGFASSGAAGGGIVLLRTGTITGTGTISANGGSANNSVVDDGSGGGGAGGSILVTATTPTGLSSLTLTANGGTGGTNTGSTSGTHGPGGGGGGGVILTNGGVAMASAAGAASGTTQGGVAFGAAAGLNGVTNTQISNSIAGSTVGTTCVADVTTTLAGPSTLTPAVPSGTYTVTFANEGPSAASTVTRTVTLPAGATNIIVNGAPYSPTTTNTIDFGPAATLASGTTSTFTFSFTPATTATGSAAIGSNVTTASGQGADQAPNSSTINATIPPVANVAATITAGTSVAAGTLASVATAPKFTVNLTNNGPSNAAGVVASVQLPKGLTNVTATSGGSYDSATGLVTYASLTGLASGSPVTSLINFDAPLTNPVAATANISTTTSEAGQMADNQASASFGITPAFDLATTLTGPASSVAGDLVTLALTMTNNGPSAAATALQTAQLPAGLSGVYVSNGGFYNAGTTATSVTYSGVSYAVPVGGVIFPPVASLPGGQTVANTVSFVMPGTAFKPTATVSSASTGEINTANNTANLNGAPTSTAPAASLAVGTPTGDPANVYTQLAAATAVVNNATNVTLTVTTGNNGGPGSPSASGIVQTVQLLPGLTAANLKVGGQAGTTSGTLISFTGASYDPATGMLTFTSTSLTSGTSVSNTITFTAPANVGNNGQLLLTAAATTTNIDLVPADNLAATTVVIAPTTDLSTTLTGPATATVGQPVQYTITFTNDGPMTASGYKANSTLTSGVFETAQLPVGLASVAITDATGATVSGATYDAQTGLVTFLSPTTDPAGTTQVYNLAFIAPATNLVVRSSVGSANLDPTLTNNSASLATTVTPAADLLTSVSGPALAPVGNPVTYTMSTTNNGPSAASTVVPTLQLPLGFSPTTLQVNGTTGTLNGNVITFGTNGPTYDTTNGLVTFSTTANLAAGASVLNQVTFLMPNPPSGQVAGVASATSTTTDLSPGNNGTSVATSIAPATATTADLTASVSGSPVDAGSTLTLTANFRNNGPGAATNVAPTLQLAAGLTVGAISNGGTYNPTSGLVTWPVIASQPSGDLAAYTVPLTAPAGPSIIAVASVSSATSEPTTGTPSSNVGTTQVNITQSFDLVTRLGGPAQALPGTSLTYTVTTVNNGPSATPAGSATTQTVSVPAGQTPTNITNGGQYSSANNTITWNLASGQVAGSAGAVANSFTLVQPAAGLSLAATSAATGEGTTTNNGAAVATTVPNQPPTASAIVNAMQSPEGSTAANSPTAPTGLLISPLTALDPENALSSTTPYTIVAVPATSQGTLYYSNDGTTTGTYTAVGAGKTLTAAQAGTLRFLPALNYVGNATFTYLATDNAGNQSPAVYYTLPVGADQAATYAKYNAGKGGTAANKYVTGDVLTQFTDLNAAVFSSTGTLYDTQGVPAAGTANGLGSAVLTLGTLPAGVSLDPTTGRLYVSNASLLADSKTAQTYTVTITTTDLNGGVTAVPVSFTIGANPLPVVLTAFTASAVLNRDAQLSWTTASEVNSAYFDLERSFDGTTFAKVGRVAAQGTTPLATTYAFTDQAVASRATGAVFYRLKQVDRDAQASYSPVRSVRFTQAASLALRLYPNPAQDATTLDLRPLPATGTYQVLVLDATGRQVRALTVGGGLAQRLDLHELANGTYHVLVTGTLADGAALRQTLRLTKE